MKKRIIAVIVILAVLVALFFIGTGFQKRMDVVLVDYSVSEDGTEITLDVGIPTSTGYIRQWRWSKTTLSYIFFDIWWNKQSDWSRAWFPIRAYFG